MVHSAIELLVMISEGFKVSDFLRVQMTNHQTFTPLTGIRGWKFFACKHVQGYSTSCTWCHLVLFL